MSHVVASSALQIGLKPAMVLLQSVYFCVEPYLSLAFISKYVQV